MDFSPEGPTLRISKMDSSQAELYYAHRKEALQQKLLQTIRPSNTNALSSSALPLDQSAKEFIVFNQPAKARKYKKQKSKAQTISPGPSISTSRSQVHSKSNKTPKDIHQPLPLKTHSHSWRAKQEVPKMKKQKSAKDQNQYIYLNINNINNFKQSINTVQQKKQQQQISSDLIFHKEQIAQEDSLNFLQNKYRLLGDLGNLDLQIKRMQEQNNNKQEKGKFYLKYMKGIKEKKEPSRGGSYAQAYSQKRVNSQCDILSQSSFDNKSFQSRPGQDLFKNQSIRQTQIRKPMGKSEKQLLTTRQVNLAQELRETAALFEQIKQQHQGYKQLMAQSRK